MKLDVISEEEEGELRQGGEHRTPPRRPAGRRK